MAAFYQNPQKNEVPSKYRFLIVEFGITEADDPYVPLKRLDFEKWRSELDASLDEWRKKRGYTGSKAGRPGFDPVFMFTVHVVQTRFGLTDQQMVGLMKSDIRLKQLLGTWHPDDVPSTQTLWTNREMWAEHRTLERLFDRHLEEMRYILPDLGEKAVAVDSAMMPVPIPRNTPAENELIKAGKADELWVCGIQNLCNRKSRITVTTYLELAQRPIQTKAIFPYGFHLSFDAINFSSLVEPFA